MDNTQYIDDFISYSKTLKNAANNLIVTKRQMNVIITEKNICKNVQIHYIIKF
jgi:hypothetical protein